LNFARVLAALAICDILTFASQACCGSDKVLDFACKLSGYLTSTEKKVGLAKQAGGGHVQVEGEH